jgi:sensor histidine kinase YesM
MIDIMTKLEIIKLTLRLIYLFRNNGRNGVDTVKSINDEFNNAEKILQIEKNKLCGCKND